MPGVRWWPAVAALFVCAALTITSVSSGAKPLPAALLLAVAAYFVASQLPRRLSVAVVGLAILGIAAALLVLESASVTFSVAADAVEGLLPLIAAWFTGDAVAVRRRYLASLAEQAERERLAEAERARRELREERVRIARELHDVVAHALTVVTVQAGVGRRLMARRPQEASSALETIETIGRTAQEELRVVLALLREDGFTATTLSPVPRLRDLAELAETVRASGTAVDLRIEGPDARLSPALQLTIYRVVQEALTNAVRHAPGASAHVGIAITATDVRVEIANDGDLQGQRHQHAPRQHLAGHGIAGMRERVGAFGGTLTAGPCPGGGFAIQAQIPAETPHDN